MTRYPKVPGGHEAQSQHVVHIRNGSMVKNHSPHITETELVNRGNPSSPDDTNAKGTAMTPLPLSANMTSSPCAPPIQFPIVRYR